MNSDNEQLSVIDGNGRSAGQLAQPQQNKRSLLKIFELENEPNGSRGNMRLQERSARLQLNENLSSENIAAPNSQLETTASQETSLFRDNPIMRRQRKSQNSKLIKSKLLGPADPFATPNPPVPTNSMRQQPDSVYEAARKPEEVKQPARKLDYGDLIVPRLNHGQQEVDPNRFESRDSQTGQQNESAIPESFQRRSQPAPGGFQDAYTDELPDYSPYIEDTKAYQHQPKTVLEQGAPQDEWRPAINQSTSSSSVSAIMSPRIRHTQNGVEVNFSDSDTGIYPIREESLLENAPAPMPPVIPPDEWQNQPQYQEQYDPQNSQPIDTRVQQQDQQPDQPQETQPEQQQQDDTEDPSWDSILKGGDPPVEAEVEAATDDPSVEADSVVDEIDESQFGMDDELDDETAAEAIRSASDIQSIEKQREGYRQALRQKLAAAPVQRIFQYLDDEGEMLPSSQDQKFYLLEFNSYRYSRVYNNECRLDGNGNSFCRMCAVWQTPDLCYNPLYFEEVNLERFGGRFPYAQPAISAAHFFSSVVTLPYAMGAQPPHCCYYSAGYGRPGNKYCYQMKRPVWSLRGATLQSLLITGLVFGLP